MKNNRSKPELSEQEHWHYYIEMEIVVPNSLTWNEAEALLQDKITFYVEKVLRGEMQMFENKKIACNPRLHNPIRLLGKRTLEGPTQ